MIDDLKEDLRKSLKEMEEKTNQKIQDINKSLKTEIETIKKAESEGKLEIEKLGKRSGTTDVSITNRIQEMEERISGVEDTLEEIDSSTKENLKSNKSLSQNIQEIWETVKRPNLRITGIEEGKGIQLKGAENIFNKIIEENFPNLKKDMPMKIQEAYRTPNTLRAVEGKGQVTYNGKPTRITPDIDMETLKASIMRLVTILVFCSLLMGDSGDDWYSLFKEAIQGTRDMWRAYSDMKEANWKNSDKYFHARGNYDAAKRGPGGAWAAKVISDAREGIQRFTGHGAADSRADQFANKWGRSGKDPNHFRPAGLPSKY
ncbi:serum amyloid A-3 protein [Cricetulus griseus]|nr:serum amyloid A-3 protein [Cricetulus griseus]